MGGSSIVAFLITSGKVFVMQHTTLPGYRKTVAPAPFPLVAFAVIAAASLWVQSQPLSQTLTLGAKALPMVLLIYTVANGLRTQATLYRTAVLFGLVASLAGDIVIGFNFIAGIGAFLIAHIGYVVAMGGDGVARRGQAAALLPGAVLWGGMFALLSPRVPAELFVPVVAYLSVITIMWVRALGLALHERSAAAWIMVAGATFFVLSDSLIAINRWVVPVPQERIAIMATYYIAQYLIVRSVR